MLSAQKSVFPQVSGLQGSSPTTTTQLMGKTYYRHVANSVFEDLKASGLKDKDILAVSSEILSMLATDIQARKNLK